MDTITAKAFLQNHGTSNYKSRLNLFYEITNNTEDLCNLDDYQLLFTGTTFLNGKTPILSPEEENLREEDLTSILFQIIVEQ